MRYHVKGLLLLLLLFSGLACHTVELDPFVPKPHKYQTGFRFNPKTNSVVRTTGRGRLKSRDSWSVRSNKAGKSFRQRSGRGLSSRDSYAARSRSTRGGNRFSASKQRVVRNGAPRPRSQESFASRTSHPKGGARFSERKGRVVAKKGRLFVPRHRDSFSTQHRSTRGNYAYNAKRRQVTKARTLFNLFRGQERTRDSFSRRAGGIHGSFAFNAKHRRVHKVWNPFLPKHEKDKTSFGGRKKKMYRHYVFNKKAKSVKHRKGFFFRLMDRWKNKPYKRKKKDRELELWDPKMRRQMHGGR